MSGAGGVRGAVMGSTEGVGTGTGACGSGEGEGGLSFCRS